MKLAYSFPETGDFVDELDFTEIDELPDTLERITFVDCRFDSLSFTQCDLIGCRFENCSFELARLGGVIERCAFIGCDFRYADLLGTDFIGCKMTGSTISSLRRADFNIDGGDWSYVSLAGLTIKKRSLSGVNFTGASFTDCKFESVKLDGARFDNALVSSLSLKNSDIRGASFDMVDLGRIDFTGCTADLDFCVALARSKGIKVVF